MRLEKHHTPQTETEWLVVKLHQVQTRQYMTVSLLLLHQFWHDWLQYFLSVESKLVENSLSSLWLEGNQFSFLSVRLLLIINTSYITIRLSWRIGHQHSSTVVWMKLTLLQLLHSIQPAAAPLWRRRFYSSLPQKTLLEGWVVVSWVLLTCLRPTNRTVPHSGITG